MYGGDPQAATSENSLLLASLLTEALANAAASSSASSSTPMIPVRTAPLVSVASNPANFPFNGSMTSMSAFSPLLPHSPAVAFHASHVPLTFTSISPLNTTPTSTSAPLNGPTTAQLLNAAISAEIQRLSYAATAVRLHDDSTTPPATLGIPLPSNTLPPLSLSSIVNGVRDSTHPLNNGVDKPLDLSVKKFASCSPAEPSTSTLRATVIKNSYQPKSGGVKRSTSSLAYRPAPDPDVSDHFRRSLSGKWPRRPANYSHYTAHLSSQTPPADSSGLAGVGSPVQSRRLLAGTPKSCVSQIVINEGQVEDHFRRTFELLQRNEEQETNGTEKNDENSSTTRL